MKRFTIIFSILLALGFAGTLVYVGLSEDFVDPAEAAQLGADMDAPIWSMTLDEVLAELESQGLIETTDLVNLAASGLCSVAVKVSNGAEIYWWDLENLDENTMEYKSYQQMKEEGVIDIYGSGNIMSLTSNGPFGLLLSFYEGDVDALDKAFRALGQGGGADDHSDPVWSMTMDDILAYFVEEGFIDSVDDAYVMTAGVGTLGRGFDRAEIYWWDLENLEEGSSEAIAYESMNSDGIIDVWGQGSIMTITPNGPFGLSTSYYEGDAAALLDAFKAFGRDGGGQGSGGADDRSAPVWSMTLDDLAAYLAEQGVVDASDYIKINYSADERVRTGYRFSDQIDIVYYDFDQMEESSDAYQEYDSISSTGTLVYVNGQIGYFWLNGPFSLHFYKWGKNTVPEEEQAEIIEIFQAFGRE